MNTLSQRRACREILNLLMCASKPAHTLAGGADGRCHLPPAFSEHAPTSSRGDSAGGAISSPQASSAQQQAALEMLREAFRAAGWEASVSALVAYSQERAKTAKPETIKAMHDQLQAACGELWKDIPA